MQDLNVCLVQTELAWEDPLANREYFDDVLSKECGKHDLIILPEMFTTGFTMSPEGKGEPAHGPTLAWMQGLAARTGAVVLGSYIVEAEGRFFNRLNAVGPDGLLLSYDKRHLFRMAGEHEHYEAGRAKKVFTWKGWRICPLVCYDLRFPVWSRNRTDASGQAEYDVLVYVANWPTPRVSHWKLLLQARAIENQAYCLGVNRVGLDGNDVPYSGDSAAVDYLGQVMGSATGQFALIQTRLEWARLQRFREKFPVWRDADAFQLLDETGDA